MALVGSPNLRPGEEILWRRNANYEQAALRYLGGKLFLTDRRLIFLPHRLDEATGGRSWACELTDISAVGVEPAQLSAPFFGLAARMRRRLRVEMRSGQNEFFVVNRVNEAVERIRSAKHDTGDAGTSA